MYFARVVDLQKVVPKKNFSEAPFHASAEDKDHDYYTIFSKLGE